MSPSPVSSSRSSGCGSKALAVDASTWQPAKRRRPLPRPDHPPSEELEKSMDSQNNLSLPEDIVLQILLRLPAKSLVRFMCVCKSWFFLISDPHFAKSHFDRSLAAPTHRVLYIPQPGSHPRSVDIDAPFHHDFTVPFPNLSSKLGLSKKSPIQVRGSCRGFILLGNKKSFRNLILWNPSTGSYKAMPYAPNAPRYHHVTGLGYDETTDDYLVVMTSLRRPRGAHATFYLEIFSVRKNSWEVQELKYPPFPKVDTFSRIRINWGLFFNGVIHWNTYGKIILCFDLRLRSFSEMITPHKNDHLMVVGGCLAAHDGTKVWVMKKYEVQSSWTKYCDASIELRPICVNKDGEMIAFLGLPSGGGKLVKLNDKGEQLESRDCCSDIFIFGRAVYMESLISLSCQIRSRVQTHHENPPQDMAGVEQVRNVVDRLKGINLLAVSHDDDSRVAFLLKKLFEMEFSLATVNEKFIYDVDPEHLVKPDEQNEQYYYTKLMPSKPKKLSYKRTTPLGIWKKQGSICTIFIDGVKLASKSRLYWKPRDGTGLGYVMYEYKLDSQVLDGLLNDSLELLEKVDIFALCRISSRAETSAAASASTTAAASASTTAAASASTTTALAIIASASSSSPSVAVTAPLSLGSSFAVAPLNVTTVAAASGETASHHLPPLSILDPAFKELTPEESALLDDFAEKHAVKELVSMRLCSIFRVMAYKHLACFLKLMGSLTPAQIRGESYDLVNNHFEALGHLQFAGPWFDTLTARIKAISESPAPSSPELAKLRDEISDTRRHLDDLTKQESELTTLLCSLQDDRAHSNAKLPALEAREAALVQQKALRDMPFTI